MSGREDQALLSERYGTQSQYTVAQTRCLCYGKRAGARRAVASAQQRPPITSTDATHTVWVAFLLYENEEYEQERSMRDYTFVPLNRLTVMLTGYNFIHCQLVFWDDPRQCYYTYSVDGARAVHVWDRKSFRAGWEFVRLQVTESQELLVQNFLARQLGKPINRAGQLSVLFWPMSGNGETWFCSELVTAALEEAGLVDYDAWPDVSEAAAAAPHNLFFYLTEGYTLCTAEHMNGNPVAITTTHQLAARTGKIAMQRGQLPQSVAERARQAELASRGARVPYYQAARGASPLDRFVVRK